MDDFQMCRSSENIFMNLIVVLSLLKCNFWHVHILSLLSTSIEVLNLCYMPVIEKVWSFIILIKAPVKNSFLKQKSSPFFPLLR